VVTVVSLLRVYSIRLNSTQQVASLVESSRTTTAKEIRSSHFSPTQLRSADGGIITRRHSVLTQCS